MINNNRKAVTRAIHPSLLALSLAIACTATQAAPKASSNAWDMSIHVSVATLPVLTLGAQKQVGFAAQTNAFVDAASVVSFDSGAGALARLTTGAINVETEWVPDPNFFAVGAQASIENVNLNAVSILGGASILSLHADLLRSTAIVTGTCPPPQGARMAGATAVVDGYIFRNGFDLENLQAGGDAETPGISILASSMTGPLINLPLFPAPNTTLDVGSILTLVLNEQTVGGDGINSRSVTRNGLHLTVNVLNVVTAEVILSHADAAIDCNG